MLERLYLMNEAYKQGRLGEDAPQLCVIDRFDFSEPPLSIADPVTLRILDGERYKVLPRNLEYWDAQEFELWRARIKSVIFQRGGETNKEIAFIKKSYIPEENRL